MAEMRDGSRLERLELYSNATVGFLLLQAIAFSYSIGTNKFFNCIALHDDPTITIVLLAHLCISSLLACLAIIVLGRQAITAGSRDRGQLRWLYRAKCLAILWFMALPVGVLCYEGQFHGPARHSCFQVPSS
jgi:uncharacterized membrane protein